MRNRLLPLLALSLLPLSLLSAQGTRFGLSAGMEFHDRDRWLGSSMGPTAAISLGTRLGSRFDVQGILGLSAGTGQATAVYPPCAFPGCVTQPPSRMNAAWGATAEIAWYARKGRDGIYLLGGMGFLRFTGKGLPESPTRALLSTGIGAAAGKGAHQVFLEARIQTLLSPGTYPGWQLPLRIGWRIRL